MPQWSAFSREFDWSSVSHAYGPAIEVPGLLRALRSGKQSVRQQAYRDLADLMVDQGSRSAASVAIVPFLIDVVADAAAPDRFAACQVLAAIAVGDESSWLSDPVDPKEMRSEVARRAGMTKEELEDDHRAWIASARTDEERDARTRRAEWRDLEAERDEERWSIEAYDAVRAGVPVYLEALDAPEKALRLHATYLLAWFPEEAKSITPAMTRLVREEPDPIVAAAACVAAGLAGVKGDAALIEALSARRASGNRGEAWSAVLGLSRIVTHPDRSLVADLYSCLFGATGPVPYWPFLEGDMSAMAALTIRDLGADVAQDRVAVLAERITNLTTPGDSFTLLTATLDAAFPNGPMPTGTPFDDLDQNQKTALLSLADSRVLEGGSMVSMLLGRYNLPQTAAALRAYCSR
ncbi:hypothetical protein ABZS77_16095 [Micromonospora sp. NPDC005298]|uniref:hypothetical protein n=1 Tax=Micromonospora sp. NPDC005298 TaxID=3156873 RepID=UPI0033BA5058